MNRLIVILSVVILAVGCREPRSLERFVKGEGPYRFIVDMSDTLAVYDFDFYTRIDVHGADIPAEAAIDVCWMSPSGVELTETVYLPMAREVYAPYRAGVSPSEPGVWILTVTFQTLPKGLTGLGLVSRKNPMVE